MNNGLLLVLGLAFCSVGVALADDEAAPMPAQLPDPSLNLTPLPPFPGPAPLLTPQQSAPALPPLKLMGGFSLQTEYLVWWVRDSGMPGPLVTTGTPQSLGVLGVPGTQPIYGDAGFNHDALNGLRVTGTFWLDAQQKCGWQVRGFVLDHHTETFFAQSDPNGDPVLGRPVINALTNREAVSLISYPGAFSGAVGTSLSNRLWGLEANLTGLLKLPNRRSSSSSPAPADMANSSGGGLGLAAPMMRLYWLAGFRYLRMDERLDAYQVPTLLQDGVAGFFGEPLLAGDTLVIQDLFLARSQFWGPQVGAAAEMKLGPAVVNGSFRLAMGPSHEVVDIYGSTALLRPGLAPQLGPGGLLAQPYNSGRHSADTFAVVPELGLSVGIQPMRNIRATLGYNFLYWSSVVRATDQVDRTVNPTQVPSSLQYGQLRGPAAPQVLFDRTDFWAQGLNFSLELRF